MLQLVLFAAIATGSTALFVKHISTVSKQVENCERDQETLEEEPQVYAAFQSTPAPNSDEQSFLVNEGEGAFRFSSSRNGSGILRSKSRIACREINKFGHRSRGVIDRMERKRMGRQFPISLTRIKVKRTITPKHGSFSSKDNSLFGFGLCLAIVCMMSVGKYEFYELSNVMDETAKVVQELKSEIDKRKSSRNLLLSSSATDTILDSKKISGSKHLINESERMKDYTDVKDSSTSATDDGECASSVVTEEQDDEAEVLDMDQLQAELESELQKLPWSDSPCNEGTRLYLDEIEVSTTGFHEMEENSPDSYQFHGVVATKLEQKLCRVLMQQQDQHIVELESDLHITQSKLQEKEAELQALKDCVRCLTEFSPSSDDESNANEAPKCTGIWDYSNVTGSESKKSLSGMKRPLAVNL